MLVLSFCLLLPTSLLAFGFSDTSLMKLPVMYFRSRTITPFSFEDSKVGINDLSAGSNMVCGARCLTSQINCTGFKLDGQQRCHLLRSWSFASEQDPSVDGIKVYEVNASAWSKVMIIGGKTSGYGGTSNIEVIDLVNAKHCTSPTPLLPERYAMPSFVLGSKLLVIGGSGNELDITSYNYEAHTWESIGTLAAEWADYSLGRIRDSWILLMGGDYDGDKTEMTLILNANGSLDPGPDLPMAAKGFCACGLDDNHIFIAGGKDSGGTELQTTYVLDWTTQQWASLDPMALPRYYVECGTFLSTNQELSILVVGGLQNQVVINPHTEIFNWPQQTWRAGPDFAFPKTFLSRMNKFDGKLFVFGGYQPTSQVFLSDIYMFIPKNESWVRFPLDLNIERRDFGIMMIPDGIVSC
ncbi:uncharacterized protein LOC131890703 [Tigriopus californicus]|uniref:uncharacterized protein LOC131890703 n=1 Tax=Tigriopus californicus TaxID=6832 RepID=UPI0027D9E71F|nr:uncharacterized protein LOC131890703 [Tigriopus californicus]